jgi:transposase
MRYELIDYEWTAIKPMLPNKPRGVRRVNDRRVLNGILWVLRSGAPCAICQRPMVPARHTAAVQIIDASVVRVHQHGACAAAPQSGLIGLKQNRQ